jgi:hypothetical protein
LMRRGKGRGLAVAAGERHGWPGGGVERSKRHQRSTGRLYLTFYHYNGIVTVLNDILTVSIIYKPAMLGKIHFTTFADVARQMCRPCRI